MDPIDKAADRCKIARNQGSKEVHEHHATCRKPHMQSVTNPPATYSVRCARCDASRLRTGGGGLFSKQLRPCIAVERCKVLRVQPIADHNDHNAVPGLRSYLRALCALCLDLQPDLWHAEH